MRQVARALRDFASDQITVWLKNLEAGDPYLELLDPGAGILIIQAPLIRTVTRRRRLGWRTFNEDEVVRIRDDIAERAEYLRKRIDRSLVRSLPVESVLAAPDHDEVRIPNLGKQDAGLPILTRTDLTETGLQQAIRRILGVEGAPRLSEQDESRARAVINPGVIISPSVTGSGTEGSETLPLFQDPEVAPEDVIRVMDREQERVSEHLGWGYRILRGVAGSGKTLVLTHRARYLRQTSNYRILLLCYNRLLANALQLMVDSSDRITVTNIDRLAYKLAGKHTGQGPPNFGELRRRAAEKAARLPESRQYDVVLVDEAQDFDHAGLDLAYSMLKPPRRELGVSGQGLKSYHAGHFVMALDSAQNVYRRSMTWNPPGVTGRGRTTVFRRNYRNTREILWFAWTFLEGTAGWSLKTPDTDDLWRKISPEAAPRSGPMPKVLDCQDVRGEARVIAAEVERLMDAGVGVGEIAVMYGHHDLEGQLRQEFSRLGLPYFHIQQKDKRGYKRNRDKAVAVRDKVRVSTLQGLKGLEFSRVLIGGVNQAFVYDVPEEEQGAAVKQLLYVAMTRAMDELVITTSGDGEMGRALRKARSGSA